MALGRLSGGVLVVVLMAASAADASQAPTSSAPLVSEAERREILAVLRAITPEAFREALARAEAGDLRAQVIVGLALKNGDGTPKDPAGAERWLRAAAEREHPMGQNGLGLLYQAGVGVPSDAAMAAQWFKKAADRGYAQAAANLGMAYYLGTGVPGDAAEAVRIFRMAADQGNSDAQHWLALAHLEGKGVLSDAREAVVWLRKAADQGDPEAQVDLALVLYQGKGVRKDKDEAAAWLLKASDEGYARGSRLLAELYLEKRDPLSTLAAIDRLGLSVRQGSPLGAYQVGLMYSSRFAPHPIPKNELIACTWFTVAGTVDAAGSSPSDSPNELAAMRKDLSERIKKLRKTLGPERSAECDARAAAWLERADSTGKER